MEDDAISTLMDIDESPLNGAGFLDEDDGDLLVGPSRGGRGHAMDPRGPLPYTGFSTASTPPTSTTPTSSDAVSVLLGYSRVATVLSIYLWDLCGS
jgi:hypothetical protein